MDLVWQIIGVVFAVALLVLAFKVYEKEKTGHATAIATLSLVALCFSFPWFQGFFRTHILGKISDLGKQMNSFQLTMGEMQDQLSKHQKELDTIQAKIRQDQFEVMTSQCDITNLTGSNRRLEWNSMRVERLRRGSIRWVLPGNQHDSEPSFISHHASVSFGSICQRNGFDYRRICCRELLFPHCAGR